jgi:hypothetical protein
VSRPRPTAISQSIPTSSQSVVSLWVDVWLITNYQLPITNCSFLQISLTYHSFAPRSNSERGQGSSSSKIPQPITRHKIVRGAQAPSPALFCRSLLRICAFRVNSRLPLSPGVPSALCPEKSHPCPCSSLLPDSLPLKDPPRTETDRMGGRSVRGLLRCSFA